MNITLYYTSSDNSQMHKSLQQITTIEAHPVDVINVAYPTFKIGSKERETLLNCNYAYIPELHRYYYIRPIGNYNNNNFILSLEVDVLMSFETHIKRLPAIISKCNNEDLINMNFNDGSFINQEGRFLETKIFPSGLLEKPHNILIVAGG